MFTGIIEAIGDVVTFNRRHDVVQLGVRQESMAPRAAIGDSVAIDGVCLTVVRKESATMFFDVSHQTLKDTTFGEFRPGVRVNMESAMTLNNRLGGHLVTGHVDGVGRIRSKEQRGGGGFDLCVEASADILRYVIRKGSIAVDGISLTVAEVSATDFTVVIIPHTSMVTTLQVRVAGQRVNLEVDMIGKYVERFVLNYIGGGTEIVPATDDDKLLKKLKEEGFILPVKI
ncbi:riboflavin synthase [Candidatus Magnetobacterium casense]|uniref:Riboflavin synthase n=1 Tax=Candidatus Magnetobacterium casense TaxID=1455061 RepID=A0ABS6RVE0_9BACT|nr:riboflavin synthase [Candidatus Magnetobacterium casensis]MBV6340238.1 riboflavin synthase [Candidatus Magnetobacterium casensis]